MWMLGTLLVLCLPLTASAASGIITLRAFSSDAMSSIFSCCWYGTSKTVPISFTSKHSNVKCFQNFEGWGQNVLFWISIAEFEWQAEGKCRLLLSSKVFQPQLVFISSEKNFWCQILWNLHYVLVFIFICHNKTLFKQNNFYAGSWLKIAESNIWHLKTQDEMLWSLLKTLWKSLEKLMLAILRIFFYRWEGWWKVKK